MLLPDNGLSDVRMRGPRRRVLTASCCPYPSAPCSTVFVRCGYLKYNRDSHRLSALTGVSRLAGRAAGAPGTAGLQATSRSLVPAFGYRDGRVLTSAPHITRQRTDQGQVGEAGTTVLAGHPGRTNGSSPAKTVGEVRLILLRRARGITNDWIESFAERLLNSGTALVLMGVIESPYRYAGERPGQHVVAYCHTGRRGSYDYFTPRLAGDDARLCDGYWEEWGNRSDLPMGQ